MKCQHCHKNEAENTLVLVYPGGSTEMHLCAECTKLAQHCCQMAQRARGGVLSRQVRPGRRTGENPFSSHIDSEAQKKLKVNALKARLEQAVESENYEEAARLRDALVEAEKGVTVA